MAYKNLLSLTMIACIAIAAWLSLPARLPLLPVKQVKLIPDAWMEEVTAVTLDKQGKPKVKMTAPKIIHYAEQDISQVISPQLILYRPSPTPWYVSAHYAKTTHGISRIDFWQNVVIHQAATIHQPATVIRTNTLIVHPQEQTAETNELITMVQQDLIVKAKGMEANMITGDIKLLSHARGEYVPKH
jgi:lipopolysaccharide export system protein LptC